MKFILSLLFCLSAALLTLTPQPVKAASLSEWARIESENIYFYSQADTDSGLFILPRTYFVRLTGESGEFYSVEYLTGEEALHGFCLQSDVTPVDYVPETPFLVYRTEVVFSIEGDDLPDSFITEYRVLADFYGTFLYGSSTYYYVSLEGLFGYVAASACPPLDYPLNTEHTESESQQPTPNQSTGINALNIVLICALSVAAIGAVYFLFRPARSPRPQPYSDEQEDVF